MTATCHLSIDNDRSVPFLIGGGGDKRLEDDTESESNRRRPTVVFSFSSSSSSFDGTSSSSLLLGVGGADLRVRLRADFRSDVAHGEGRLCATDAPFPLHFALYDGSEETVLRLLTSRPWTARVANRRGELPLHYAVKYRREPSLIRSLLETHPDAVRAVARYWRTPLHRLCAMWRADESENDERATTTTTTAAAKSVVRRGDRVFATLDLLLRVWVRGTMVSLVDEEDETWSLPHEVARRRLASPVPDALAAAVLRDRRTARPDANGDFPLHAVCRRTLPPRDDVRERDDEEAKEDRRVSVGNDDAMLSRYGRGS